MSGLFDLTGRTALVTGASRGIGLALASGLAEAGATVVLNARSPAVLAEAADRLRERTTARVETAAFDNTDPAVVAVGLADVSERVGPVDVLVNNTGVQHREPLLDVAPEVFDEVVRTNLSSAFLVGREVARRLIEGGRTGKIVNLCSVQTDLARPGIAAYAASKGAVRMLTRSMCAEWASSGITVNGLAPGYVETELTRALVEDEEFSAWVRHRTPAGRWGRVEDLVGTCVWLCAPASDFVNGQVVYVDGGMSAVV